MPEKDRNILKEKIENLPQAPGVYQFIDSSGKILYVGKAKSIKNRVKQYFRTPINEHNRIAAMVSKISDLEIIKTDSEVEALILELNLIKDLKPRYNVNLKDDKSYPYIVITNEPFPRVFPTRRKRTDGSKYFGPFTDVKNVRFALKSVRDVFTVRSCNLKLTDENIKSGKFKVCLDYYINKCEGPCVGLVGKEEYGKMIKQVARMLNGKTDSVIKEMEEKMEDYSREMKFEQAARTRDKINSVKVYTSRQKMVTEDAADRDVFAVAREDNNACGMLLKIRDGKVIGKSHYYFTNVLDKPDSEIIDKLIVNYYSKSDFIPDEIFLGENIESKSVIEKWLSERKNVKLKIVIPKAGDRAKLVKMVKANAKLMLEELKLEKLKKEYTAPSVESLKRDLRLNILPKRIECFDISHIQGTDTVGSMIVFQDGKPKKSEYRKYKIESVSGETGKPDDFLSIREVIYRRFKRLMEEEQNFPDLVVIDGGKGQLSSAVKVLENIGIKIYNKGGYTNHKNKGVNVIGLAKKLEEIYIPEEQDPHTLPKTSSSLRLLQRVRDEAHRFAIRFHRDLRERRTVSTGLTEIPGIGAKTAQKLLIEFGSFDSVMETYNENKKKFVQRAGKRTASIIEKYLNK